mmetsp:Transcript_37648/g.99557  ORF Transcript_37648/g.99557 Transcript_37648/m.99557 type:complete len:227 (-) Transcript_37648:1222-1902(-)
MAQRCEQVVASALHNRGEPPPLRRKGDLLQELLELARLLHRLHGLGWRGLRHPYQCGISALLPRGAARTSAAGVHRLQRAILVAHRLTERRQGDLLGRPYDVRHVAALGDLDGGVRPPGQLNHRLWGLRAVQPGLRHSHVRSPHALPADRCRRQLGKHLHSRHRARPVDRHLDRHGHDDRVSRHYQLDFVCHRRASHRRPRKRCGGEVEAKEAGAGRATEVAAENM